MNGDDSEWNRWRGHTEAILENTNESLKSLQHEVKGLRGDLGTLKKEYYVFYGKAIGLGVVASIIVTAVTHLIGKVI